MWEDPADFFKTTTSPVVKEIGAGGLWIFWETWVVCLIWNKSITLFRGSHFKEKRCLIQQSLLPVEWSYLVAIQDQYVNPPVRSNFSEEGGPATEGCGVCHLAGGSPVNSGRNLRAEFVSGRFHPSGGLCYTATSTHDLGKYPSFGNDNLGDGQVGAARKKHIQNFET